MRTNELHCSKKEVKRSKGRSSVAAAAYRAGVCIEDERTGLSHNYTKKGGVELTQIFIPANAPDWLQDKDHHEQRVVLWNAAERKENRSNSQTANELEIAFPCEFNAAQRQECGEVIAQGIMKRYNCAVDIAWHRPDTNGDQRNYHAHILFTTRGFDNTTKDGWSKTKYRNFNKDEITLEGEKMPRNIAELALVRGFTANVMNEIAERDGLQVKTEHLSFEKRGIEQEPTQKMGHSATQMERKGQCTDRGDINRAIRAANDDRARVQEQYNIINLELERAKRDLARAQKEELQEQEKAKQDAVKLQKENDLARHAEASRIAWGIDQQIQNRNEAKALFEAKKNGFWSRLIGSNHRAERNYNEADQQLREKTTRWVKDIINIYSDEPRELLEATLKKHGFEIKNQSKTQNQNHVQAHSQKANQQRDHEEMRRQFKAAVNESVQSIRRPSHQTEQRDKEMDLGR